MSSIIAKTYVKALLKSMNKKELNETLESLKEIIPAFKEQKFLDILFSKTLSLDDREEFLLTLFQKPSKKFTNFIKLLNIHDRLLEIPSIAKELQNQISILNNEYEGKLISNFKITQKDKKEIEESLSKKFDAKIKLQNQVSDYDGIKVEIDSLGAEVSFRVDQLKNQIAKHIFKSL